MLTVIFKSRNDSVGLQFFISQSCLTQNRKFNFFGSNVMIILGSNISIYVHIYECIYHIIQLGLTLISTMS